MMGKAAFSVILSEGKALVSISYLEYVFWHATCCVLRRNEPSFGENRRIGHTDLILLRSLPFRNRFLSLATYRQTGKRKRETSQSVPFSASITLPTAVSFTAPALNSRWLDRLRSYPHSSSLKSLLLTGREGSAGPISSRFDPKPSHQPYPIHADHACRGLR
jgi:hypothetical protein